MRPCVVCYTEPEKIKLVCNHSFCYDCIKNWYLKNPSCPMCRKTIYFRGFYKIRNKWDQEQKEKKFDELYEEYVDDIFEKSVLPLYDIELLEWLYNKIKYKIDTVEQLGYMIENYIEIDYVKYRIYYDNCRYIKNLFVSKHKYNGLLRPRIASFI